MDRWFPAVRMKSMIDFVVDSSHAVLYNWFVVEKRGALLYA